MKICAKCEIPKLLKEYSKNKNNEDGVCPHCKECEKERKRQYYLDNQEEIKRKAREYTILNKKKIGINKKRYQIENKEEIAKYRKNNREKINKVQRKYHNNKYNTDSDFRLRANISVLIRRSLKNNKNGYHWEDLVGYTQTELKKHLESQFKDGMSWNKYLKGEIQLDHIIPKSLFNITSAKCKGFKACWSLENLQPLWAEENREKSDKLFY